MCKNNGSQKKSWTQRPQNLDAGMRIAVAKSWTVGKYASIMEATPDEQSQELHVHLHGQSKHEGENDSQDIRVHRSYMNMVYT